MTSDATLAVKRRGLLAEAIVAFLVTVVATVALYRLRHVPAIGANLHALVGLAFLLVPIRVLNRTGERFDRFGIAFGGLLDAPANPRGGVAGAIRDLFSSVAGAVPAALREIAFAFAVALIVFPPFAIGFKMWFGATDAFRFALPPDFWDAAAGNLLAVALPEEFFYRGYLQTRLDDVFPARARLLGTSVGLALPIGAALFALAHFAVTLEFTRLGVFFPALLFGWMRARRGGVGAAIVLHALSNIYSDTLAHGWFPS